MDLKKIKYKWFLKFVLMYFINKSKLNFLNNEKIYYYVEIPISDIKVFTVVKFLSNVVCKL